MLVDVVKTKNIRGKKLYSLSLVEFSNPKSYSVQFSEAKGDEILIDEDGYTKKSALKLYDEIEKEIRADIKKGVW